MFFLFLLSLLSLCDPLPRISGGLVTTASSQVAPIPAKNSRSPYYQYDNSNTTSVPMLYQNDFSNGTHQSFQNSVTSPHNQSPPVKVTQSRKNVYLLPAEPSTRTQVYSRDYKESELESISPTEGGDENERTTQDLETNFPLLRFNRDYTPDEIAEYIFVTEDEKGFVQGVAEMIEDGHIMASMDDVILYLEAVQDKLDQLRKAEENISVHKTTTKV